MARRSIGITGGIGAGKSVVSRILRQKGFKVYDCDSRASWLMEHDCHLRKSLINVLGKEAFNGERLDRAYVAGLLFGNDEIRKTINALVHKAVREDYSEFVGSIHDDIVFVESAILSTGGLVPLVDEIWLVDAPESLRTKRVMLRNGLAEEKIKERMRTQEREFDSLPKESVKIIRNDGVVPLLLQIENLMESVEEASESFPIF